MLSSWKTCCAKIPQRWVLAVMGCLASTTIYAMRQCLSTAITEMVTTTASSSNSTSTDQTCPSTNSTSSTKSSSGTYEWDEYTQGIILSSLYWGQIITPIPMGILANKYGGKHFVGSCILTSSVFSILTPVLVKTFDATGLIIVRFLLGMSNAMLLPGITDLVSQWAPPHERSKINGLSTLGIEIGIALGNALTGVLISYSSIGWPIPFYFFGGLGLVVYPLWILLCYNRPDVHPFVSEKEKSYLHVRISDHRHKDIPPIPWRYILTSGPVLALLIGKVGYAWGLSMLNTYLPKYMKSVLKFSIKANGLLNALPTVTELLVNIGSSWLADWLIETGKLSRTNTRKLFMSIASVGAAIFIIAASYAGCNRIVVVVFFTAGKGVVGMFNPSLQVNQIDLAPNYCSTLSAMAGSVVSLLGIVTPYMIGILTPNQTLSEWRIVFWIACVLYTVSAIVYNVWADGNVQYWNDPNFRSDIEIKKKKLVSGNASSSR